MAFIILRSLFNNTKRNSSEQENFLSRVEKNFLTTDKKEGKKMKALQPGCWHKAFIAHELLERRTQVQARRGMGLQKHRQLEGVIEHDENVSGLPVSV